MLEADGPHGRSSSLFSFPDFLIFARPLVSGCVLLAPVMHDIQFFTHTSYIDTNIYICAHWDQLSLSCHFLSFICIISTPFWIEFPMRTNISTSSMNNNGCVFPDTCSAAPVKCSGFHSHWFQTGFFQQWVHYWMVFPGFLWQIETFWIVL